MIWKKRVANIEQRNKRVELDKKWETSMIRRICIMIITYVIVVIYSYLIKSYDNVLLSSLVPVLGFFSFNFIVKDDKKNMGT